MPKRKDEEIIRNETIIQQSIEEVMHGSMMPYAEYVVMERALPRVEDGLKPVQRRILYTMMELSNDPDKPHKKSARIAGDTMGKYHPHGDTSIYDAMVRMAQDFAMRAPLVDGHGNFGSIDGDSAAAMRYTEVRMTPLALELLRDIEKNTVPFRLNFDDTLKEPDLLPGRFPNLLVNGAMGIAVGLATNIPTHNLGEVVDAVVAQIDKPDITVEELMKYLPGPDFPTGGILMGASGAEEAYKTGRGKVVIRAKCEIEPATNGKTHIVIHEIPYQVNKAAMLEKILKLSEERKDVLGGIGDIRDESDRNGMRAVIEIKKGSDPEKILQYLYKYSDLQVNFGINMVAISQGKPMQMGLWEINRHYIDHQVNVVTRRTEYDLEQARAREHIVEGLLIAIANIDEVIAIIKSSKTPPQAKERLIERFALSAIQAQAILDMRLQRLTGLEVEKLQTELEQLKKLIAELVSILESPKKLLGVIKKELGEIRKKFADARRTVIEAEAEEAAFNPQDFIVVEEVVVAVTRKGYVKRVSEKNFQRINRENDADDLTQGDSYLEIIHTATDQKLLVFTAQGSMAQLAVGSLADGKWRDKPTHISALIAGFGQDEVVVAALDSRLVPLEGELLFTTKDGMVKRSSFQEYQTRYKRLAACSLKTGDSVVSVEVARSTVGILFVTKRGMSLLTRGSQVSATGRVSQGVRGIQLELGDEVLFAGQIDAEGEIALITDKGYAKRVLSFDFVPQNRGGKGVACFTFHKSNANGNEIICASYVKEPCRFSLQMRNSESIVLQSEDVVIERLAGRGQPTQAMVLMGNDIIQVTRMG